MDSTQTNTSKVGFGFVPTMPIRLTPKSLVRPLQVASGSGPATTHGVLGCQPDRHGTNGLR